MKEKSLVQRIEDAIEVGDHVAISNALEEAYHLRIDTEITNALRTRWYASVGIENDSNADEADLEWKQLSASDNCLPAVYDDSRYDERQDYFDEYADYDENEWY